MMLLFHWQVWRVVTTVVQVFDLADLACVYLASMSIMRT
jgi:hypothetical protein